MTGRVHVKAAGHAWKENANSVAAIYGRPRSASRDESGWEDRLINQTSPTAPMISGTSHDTKTANGRAT